MANILVVNGNKHQKKGYTMKTITFWSKDENDETLINEVLYKGKTATCTPKCWYYDTPGEEPTFVGDIVAVLDAKRVLRGMIEITENYEIRFGDSNMHIASGELYDSIEGFKNDHISCWESDLKRQGITLDDDTIMVVEHFKLIPINATE